MFGQQNGQCKQNTIACNFYDLKSIHVNPKFNNDLHKWLDKTCGSDDIGHVEASRGKVHEYLAMTVDHTEEGRLRINIRK